MDRPSIGLRNLLDARVPHDDPRHHDTASMQRAHTLNGCILTLIVTAPIFAAYYVWAGVVAAALEIVAGYSVVLAALVYLRRGGSLGPSQPNAQLTSGLLRGSSRPSSGRSQCLRESSHRLRSETEGIRLSARSARRIAARVAEAEE